MLKTFGAVLGLSTVLSYGAEELTNRFGFAGPEIFPIENQISQIKNADIDADGL